MDSVKTLDRQKRKSKLWIIGGVMVVVIIILLVALLTIRLVTGRGLGLRSLPRTLISLVLAISNQEKVAQYNHGEYTDIIFLHHSTGNNLVEQGNVRQLFSQAGNSFWDQSYNYQGLRDPEGNLTGYAYTVPRDNTDPDGLARVFNQQIYEQPINALSGLMQHEVIIVKSCFTPTSNITSDEQLEEYKNYYLGMRETMASNPGKVFVLMTQPPLNPAETNPEEATRARILADWLKSDDFHQGLQNLFVFDFFNYLANDDPSTADFNMLRKEYRNGGDSHPNQAANQEIAPHFVDFVIQAIQEYRSSQVQ
jgi:hypothetical protein